MSYSPEPLSRASDAHNVAYAFGALYGHVLRTAVTRDSIRTLPFEADDWTRTQWVVSAFEGVKPRPFELTNGTWLFAAQTLGVREASADGRLWLTTIEYTYQWQAEADNSTWLVRWCYRREDQGRVLSPEVRAHAHVNATPAAYDGVRPFPKLYLPGGRVAIEDLAAFLLGHGGCERVSANADAVIEEARRIFARIRARAALDS